jgi:hypothetical protein
MYTNIGSGAVKLELSVSGTGILEERQLAGVIIVIAKSSRPLSTWTGKLDTSFSSI